MEKINGAWFYTDQTKEEALNQHGCTCDGCCKAITLERDLASPKADKGKGLPSTFRPPPTYQKPVAYLETDNQLLQSQIDELVKALMIKYLENPDQKTRKLLIIHMGKFFFALSGEKDPIEADLASLPQGAKE